MFKAHRAIKDRMDRKRNIVAIRRWNREVKHIAVQAALRDRFEAKHRAAREQKVWSQNKLQWRQSLEDAELLSVKLRRAHKKAIHTMTETIERDNEFLFNTTISNNGDLNSMTEIDYERAKLNSRVSPMIGENHTSKFYNSFTEPLMPNSNISVNINRAQMMISREEKRMKEDATMEIKAEPPTPAV